MGTFALNTTMSLPLSEGGFGIAQLWFGPREDHSHRDRSGSAVKADSVERRKAKHKPPMPSNQVLAPLRERTNVVICLECFFVQRQSVPGASPSDGPEEDDTNVPECQGHESPSGRLLHGAVYGFLNPTPPMCHTKTKLDRDPCWTSRKAPNSLRTDALGVSAGHRNKVLRGSRLHSNPNVVLGSARPSVLWKQPKTASCEMVDVTASE